MGLIVATLFMLDLVTAGPAHEANPLALALMSMTPLDVIAKVAEVTLVVSVIDIAYRKHPTIARTVGLIAIVAGMVGVVTNIT